MAICSTLALPAPLALADGGAPTSSTFTAANGVAEESGAGFSEGLASEAPAASGGGVSESFSSEASEAPASGGAEATAAPGSPASASLPAGPIIGTNDGAGWGREAARRIVAGHIVWNRVELGASTPNTLRSSLADGFKVLAIVGNLHDETPLSAVEPRRWGAGVVSELRENPGISIAEAGNEMFLKGGVANPVQYGRMYLAAVEAMRAAGIHTPLLFNVTGDYPFGSWAEPRGWSSDQGGGGWLRDAVRAVPGLAHAIAENGISVHPYGGVTQNSHDEWGVASVAAQEAVAATTLGSIPPFYVTEFGYDLARCGSSDGACSPREQASLMRVAYDVFLADPHVAGIWWYQSHDDGSGRWGFMNAAGSVRPSFWTLSTIATFIGQ